MCETAKANGADPYYYFKYLLDTAGVRKEEILAHKGDPDKSYLDKYLPWSEEYLKYEAAEKAAYNQLGEYVGQYLVEHRMIR